MNIGVFSIDPGGATGLWWGIFNPHAKSIEETLKARMNAGSCTVTGDERAQITEIADIWQAFFSSCVRSALLPPENVWLVCEDFVYTAGNTYGGDSAKISTAIIWGIEGYRMGMRAEWLKGRGRKQAHMPPMILQTASQAKQFATSARIKEWDLWEKGFAGKREHEFSAMQHCAFFLYKYRTKHSGG